MRWTSIPARPLDDDAGQVSTDSVFAIYTSRPARVAGKKNCFHSDDLELSFLERGTTYARIGDRDVVLRAGQYSVISAGVEHSTHTREQATTGVYLQLTRDLADRAADDLGVAAWGRRHTEPCSMTPELHRIVTTLKTELSSGEGAPSLVEALTCYLIGSLLRTHSSVSTQAERCTAPSGVQSRLRRSVDLMHACPGQALSLEELAAAAGLSKFRFAHVFKAEYGVSPYRYLLQLRVRSAADQIDATDLPLTLIAHDLGFASSSRLSQAFRREYGVSPSQWRRRAARSGRSERARSR